MHEVNSEPLSIHYSQEDIEKEAKCQFYNEDTNDNVLYWECLHRILCNYILRLCNEREAKKYRGVENILSGSVGGLSINWSTIELGEIIVKNIILREEDDCGESQEIRVPQKCVDNHRSDDCQLIFWAWLKSEKEFYAVGSITPVQLKQKGRYEPGESTYWIERYQLVEKFFTYEWRQHLDSQEIGVPSVPSWREWQENLFDDAWQTVAGVIDIIETQEPSFASGWRDRDDLTEKTILELIYILSTSKDKLTRLRVIELLGRKGKGNQDAIASLVNLRNISTDEDLRREAAGSLGEIDPDNVQAGIKKVKMIDLGMQPHRVALVATLTPGSDRDNIQINFRVNSVGSEFLPPHLKMSVLDDRGETFDEITSRTEDDAMQLDFAGEEGDLFTFKLALGDACFTEEFVI